MAWVDPKSLTYLSRRNILNTLLFRDEQEGYVPLFALSTGQGGRAEPPADRAALIEPSVPRSVIAAFEDRYRWTFDLAPFDGEWGNTHRYKHDGVQQRWEGWRDGYIATSTGQGGRAEAPSSDDDEHFLTAYVSKDGHVGGIDHPTDADWRSVLSAHTVLRDRLNERIAEQEKCPFRPADAEAPADRAALIERLERASGRANREYEANANNIDSDCEPHWSSQIEALEDEAAIREAIAALRAPEAGWRTMDSAPKDGTLFGAVRYWPSGNVDIDTFRWEGPPNYWVAIRGDYRAGTCIRPDYQDKYLWAPLPPLSPSNGGK